MPDNLDGQRAQLMILAVSESLRRRDNDRLARMDAQRVKVLHVTDRDTVVEAVANDLIFYLLPTFKTLLDQYLRRERESLLGQAVQFVLVVSETTTEATQGVGGTDDNRITQVGSRAAHLLYVLASLAINGLDVYLVELLNKKFAVFSIHDGLDRSTQHAHVIFFEYTTLVKLDTTVKGCLTSKAEQDAVRTFLLDDPLYEIRLNGQKIYLVCHTL